MVRLSPIALRAGAIEELLSLAKHQRPRSTDNAADVLVPSPMLDITSCSRRALYIYTILTEPGALTAGRDPQHS